MSMKINLKRLMKKQAISSVIRGFMEGPITIVDLEGKVILGNDIEDPICKEYPIELGGEIIGVVKGGDQASSIAALISLLASQELEKRDLGRETLEKYKEISVMYNITEKLAASLDPKEVAQLVIEEIRKLIKADNISVMILNNDSNMCEILAASGREFSPKLPIEPGKGIAGSILLSGKAEIINDVNSDPRYIGGAMKISSLICAPLKIKDRVIGTVNLSSFQPVNYKAEDMKILSAVTLQAAAAIENARLYDRLKDTFLTTVYTLAETIEKRDPYTGGHTKRVMHYSIAMGEVMGLTGKEIEKLGLSAILHDVGKIGIRDNVLLKEDKLGDEEFRLIKMHTTYGKEVLKHVKYFKDIIPGVLNHHERYDGKGYPEGLKGEEIDIIARIIAVADAYDAMTTDRPYRKALSYKDATEEIKKCSGTQFDPVVVEAFIKAKMKH